MTYTSNSPQAFQQVLIFQDAPWYPTISLTTLSQILLATDLASPTSKLAALTALSAAVVPAPYSIPDGTPLHPLPIRFAAGNPYLFFACGSFELWHHVIGDLGRVLQQVEPISDTDIDAYYAALDRFNDQISTGYGVFNLSSFEIFYSLQWF